MEFVSYGFGDQFSGPMGYNNREYWTNLLEKDELSQIAHPWYPLAFNEWLYRNARRSLSRFLVQHRVTVPRRVFEAGAGTGFWSTYWMSQGAENVDGCDIVPAAVERLSKKFPGQFLVRDLSNGRPTSRTYPLVTAMNILLHITQDAAFSRALNGLTEIVEPGGFLLLAEPAVHDRRRATPFSPDVHARIRHVSSYDTAGMKLVGIGPTAVIAADPIEGSIFWRLLWRVETRLVRFGSFFGSVVGGAMYVVDPLLLPFTTGPSGKYLLLQRTG